jgi:hypothetical protein
MRSSVLVFQLGAVLVMSVVRASLRAKGFEDAQNELRGERERVSGHELD